MRATFQIKNQAAFTAALKQRVATTSKSAEEVVNRAAYNVAWRAATLTPGKDPKAIERELEFEKPTRIKAVKGVSKARNVYSKPAALIYRIINAQRGRKERKGLFGRDMREAARKKLSARKKGVGFLKLGWVSVMRILQPHVGSFKRSIAGINTIDTSRGLGQATAAKNANRLVALITNQVRVRSKKGLDLIRLGAPALEQALRLETADMMRHLERKLRDSFRR